jgi:hypothetical protein
MESGATSGGGCTESDITGDVPVTGSERTCERENSAAASASDSVMAYAIYKPIYASLPIYAYYLSAIVD